MWLFKTPLLRCFSLPLHSKASLKEQLRGPVKVFISAKECTHSTTDGPRGPGGVSRVSGGRDDSRAFSNKPRWIPPSSLRRDALWKESGNDVIFRKVQGILNKLTPESFEKLSDDILAIGLSSREILKGVILLIFKKSVDEPKYSSMYALLCRRLAEEAPNFEPPDQPNTFRTLLLNNCRTEFEKRIEAVEGHGQPDSNGTGPTDDEDRTATAKRKMLGNIKFIGELGKLEILSEHILHKCIKTLLYGIHKPQDINKAREFSEVVECLAQIMKTCGRILDSEKGKVLMTQYFDRMEALAEMPEFPPRIRFMLRDVIELRKSGWIIREAIRSEGPMPINQIRVDDSIRGGFGGGHRPTPNAGLDGLFRNPLKTRAGLDDMLGVSNLSTPSQFLPPPPAPQDPYNKGYVGNNNGYSGSNSYRSNRGSTGIYFGGRHNNYNNNKHNNQQHFGNGKDMPPRFKKPLLPPGGGTLIEDISLRPAAFKTPQPKPAAVPLGTVRTGVLLTDTLSSPQIQMVKDTPILIKQASADKGKAFKNKGLSKEEVTTRLTTILQDKLTVETSEECALHIKEIKFPERLQTHVLRQLFNYNLNNNGDEERCKIVRLIGELKKAGILSGEKILEAIRDVVNTTAEKEPNIVTDYVKDSVLQELVSLSAVGEWTEGGDHYPLLFTLLQALLASEGNQKLLQRFNESKVNLLNHINGSEKTKERLAEILAERGLTFLYPLSSIQSSLWKQLLADPNPTAFYKWVKDNMDPDHYTNPDFISALAAVVIKYIAQESSGDLMETSAGVDKQLQDKERGLLEKYKPVLQAFLNDRSDLQMIVIYSLQVLCHSLQFPKGMLLRWFMNLYDGEIVEEEAFMKWKEDITDVYPGKGEALFQVNQWLIWLAEAEEEEEEDDEAED